MNKMLKPVIDFATFPWENMKKHLGRNEFFIAGYLFLVQIVFTFIVLPIAVIIYFPLYALGKMINKFTNEKSN